MECYNPNISAASPIPAILQPHWHKIFFYLPICSFNNFSILYTKFRKWNLTILFHPYPVSSVASPILLLSLTSIKDKDFIPIADNLNN
jgi:hypothetical protein